MLILYSHLVTDDHLSPDQRGFARGLRGIAGTSITTGAPIAAGGSREHKNFQSAQDWVTAFFEKGAEEVLGYYADEFVWEDIEFMQTITTKEELYKAFVVFNNSGPERSEEHTSELQSLMRTSYAVFCLKKKNNE